MRHFFCERCEADIEQEELRFLSTEVVEVLQGNVEELPTYHFANPSVLCGPVVRVIEDEEEVLH